MIIHLLGGFLGSGKTTAIASATTLLKKTGVKSASIMNDQGSHLVDSRFISSVSAACGEVSGGCFCCNYSNLDDEISKLVRQMKPDVIFAESVGSCTDLVATVLKPMLAFGRHAVTRITYSSFVDSTLLLSFLETGELPFLPETVYIWQKQLEEAMLLVVSKCDLLNPQKLNHLKKTVQKKLPGKETIWLDALNTGSVSTWLQALDSDQVLPPEKLEIDYAIYARGEENLAWLDVDLDVFTADDSAGEKSAELMNRFADQLRVAGWPVGHLKFYLLSGSHGVKWSASDKPGNTFSLPGEFSKCRSSSLLINARIQTDPDVLHKMLYGILQDIRDRGDAIINIKHSAHFAPGYPKPEHRL